MSVLFYEPFYHASDFDRLFDEAFSARTGGNNQAQRQGDTGSTVQRFMKPRYVCGIVVSFLQRALTTTDLLGQQDGPP